MWIMLNDAFLSIVKKDCPDGSLLVRARRPGDIEKVFGRRVEVTRYTKSDYLYRAVVTQDEVVRAMQNEVLRIAYGNFKDSVIDKDLHDAYMRVWSNMADLQPLRPYSGYRSIYSIYSPPLASAKGKGKKNKKGGNKMDQPA